MSGTEDFTIENGVLTKYTGPGGDVVIPAGVTEIGVFAFYGCEGPTSVTIPAGVTKIGGSAFRGCTGLTSVTIPEGVMEIGVGAFENCPGLTSVTIPESITEMNYVFTDSSPMIVAPHIPISSFHAKDKPGAACGFARLYMEKAELDAEIKAGYLKYIKGQKKKLYPLAIEHEDLLQLMFAEKIIPKKDIDLLMDEAGKQRNYAAKAAVMQYNHANFQ